MTNSGVRSAAVLLNSGTAFSYRMDGDSHKHGRGTAGGADEVPNRQTVPVSINTFTSAILTSPNTISLRDQPPAQPQSSKYRPPHLRNQGSSSGAAPLTPSFQRHGAGRSSEMDANRGSWDRNPAATTQRTSQLPSGMWFLSILHLKITIGIIR